jgi:hypothetical protein
MEIALAGIMPNQNKTAVPKENTILKIRLLMINLIAK